MRAGVIKRHRIAIHIPSREDQDVWELTGHADTLAAGCIGADAGADFMLVGVEDVDVELVVWALVVGFVFLVLG